MFCSAQFSVSFSKYQAKQNKTNILFHLFQLYNIIYINQIIWYYLLIVQLEDLMGEIDHEIIIIKIDIEGFECKVNTYVCGVDDIN